MSGIPDAHSLTLWLVCRDSKPYNARRSRNGCIAGLALNVLLIAILLGVGIAMQQPHSTTVPSNTTASAPSGAYYAQTTSNGMTSTETITIRRDTADAKVNVSGKGHDNTFLIKFSVSINGSTVTLTPIDGEDLNGPDDVYNEYLSPRTFTYDPSDNTLTENQEGNKVVFTSED